MVFYPKIMVAILSAHGYSVFVEREETMTNRNRVAMTIAGDKAQHPERYCPARRCLWKTAEVGPDGEYILNADPCRKHPELNTAPARRAINLGRSITACSRCSPEYLCAAHQASFMDSVSAQAL
jgi:hypothetical protein